ERFKKAADDINLLPRVQRELFPVEADLKEIKWQDRKMPDLAMQQLANAFKEVMSRASMYGHHQVSRELLSVRERMTRILSSLQEQKFVSFEKMFNVCEGRLGVVVTFVAILELVRQRLLDVVQAEIYGPIYLKSVEVEDSECQK
ncbi:MAG: segregation/condensation protein A, partial [Patescibacteria group bacterium]